jgi:hypothetical protein
MEVNFQTNCKETEFKGVGMDSYGSHQEQDLLIVLMKFGFSQNVGEFVTRQVTTGFSYI